MTKLLILLLICLDTVSHSIPYQYCGSVSVSTCDEQETLLSLTNLATHLCNVRWRSWP